MTRPHDQHCADCDMAEFAGVTYSSTHRVRENCYQCDGEGTAGIHNCPRCGGSGKETHPPSPLPAREALAQVIADEMREFCRRKSDGVSPRWWNETLMAIDGWADRLAALSSPSPSGTKEQE